MALLNALLGSLGIDKEVLNIPQVWEIVSIPDTPFPIPIPAKLLQRQVWRELPSELKGTEPMMSLSGGLIIPCEPAGALLNSQIRSIIALEKGTVQKIVYSGIVSMSEKLGVTKAGYGVAARNLKYNVKVISEKDGLSLYKGIDGSLGPLVMNHLPILSSCLNLDYDTMGELGGYKSGRSTYAGYGSWGMVGAAVVLSAGSAINSTLKNYKIGEANFYTAFNNIVDNFNAKYFANEYETWLKTMDNGEYAAEPQSTHIESASDDKPAFCGQCGARNTSNVKFCTSCGAPLQ